MSYKLEEVDGVAFYSVDNLTGVQKELLSLLQIIDDICKKHDLNYWIDGGTLLGAVRHQGFIPWDDDLDICLLKKDYDILLDRLDDICRLNNSLFLFYRGSDYNYWCDYLGSTRFIRVDKYGDEIPLRIDIFPVKIVENTIESIEYNRYWGDIAGLYYYGKCKFNKDLNSIKFHDIEKAIAQKRYFFEFYNNMFMTEKPLINELIKEEYLLRKAHSNFAPLEQVLYSDVFPLKKMLFEGVLVSVPNNCEKYLNASYKDWRALPILKKRKPIFFYYKNQSLSKSEMINLAREYMEFLEKWFLNRRSIFYKLNRVFLYLKNRIFNIQK